MKQKTNFEKWKERLTPEKLCEIIDNDDTHKCDHCPIYDWCRLNSNEDSHCNDVFREWAKAEADENEEDEDDFIE